jgi:hypothetical protein
MKRRLVAIVLLSGTLVMSQTSQRPILRVSEFVSDSDQSFTFIVENVGSATALHINSVQGGPDATPDSSFNGIPSADGLAKINASVVPDPNGYSLAPGQVKCFTSPIPDIDTLRNSFKQQNISYFRYMSLGYADASGQSWSDARACLFWRHSTSERWEDCTIHEWVNTAVKNQDKAKCPVAN